MTWVGVFTQIVLNLNWALLKASDGFCSQDFLAWMRWLSSSCTGEWNVSRDILPKSSSLSLPCSVLVVFPLRCHFLLCVMHSLWPLCPKAMHQTKLLCTIVQEQPSDHFFRVCLDSKWRCHLDNLIVHLQRAKTYLLNTWCSLCIVNLLAAWKVLHRAPPFLKEPACEINFKQH